MNKQTQWETIQKDLLAAHIGRVVLQESMARHTSFRIGGPADVFVQPDSRDHFVALLEWLRQRAIPYYLLGQGTNLLVSDDGVRGVVVASAPGLKTLAVEGTTLTAGSGILLTKLAHTAAKAHLSGLEFAVSIPGTLGGALVMNAGAHGGSMDHIVKNVLIWDNDHGVQRLDANAVGFSYRHSLFMQHASWTALEAVMQLTLRDPEAIRQAMAEHMAYRKRTQPVGDANAGSIFKNPLPQYAGQLIESIGAKGWVQGKAQVSLVHANFIVNQGGASAADVVRLMHRIWCAVY
ncbi:MAG: UDP-N-acetylmuramate dehydrogenase, partial [Firmicutes bacterium]|nr:UDP-N-acetylmuramate dehydrogenase [Bacillota bacterium]